MVTLHGLVTGALASVPLLYFQNNWGLIGAGIVVVLGFIHASKSGVFD